MVRITKWDEEIIHSITSGKTRDKQNEIVGEYTRLKSEGYGQEEILDKMSGGNADTRWIMWLPHAKTKIGKVV